jgi:hypothetical protein
MMVGKEPPSKSLLAMFGGYFHHEQHENDDLLEISLSWKRCWMI